MNERVGAFKLSNERSPRGQPPARRAAPARAQGAAAAAVKEADWQEF